MATARKKSAASRSPKKAKAAPAKKKPVTRKSAPAKAKPRPKAKARPAPKPARRPIPRPAAKKAAPAKGLKPAKPAKAVQPAKPAKPVKAPKPAPKAPPRLVPATDAAKAAAKAKALAAKNAKSGAKNRASNRPEPEVRPLGVLPPSAQAKPRPTSTVRPVGPSRPLATPPRGTPKPQIARKGDDRLSQDDLKHFEQRLLQERARIMGEMGHLESTVLKVNPRDAAGELSGYSYHMADAGTDSMEREKAFDIASKEGRLLLEIDDALRRVYNGTYGVCEISGKPIARARLEALPWARLSLEEQEKLEREQRAGRLTKAGEE
jgi:RNA polymerase-binding transcription factor DksA